MSEPAGSTGGELAGVALDWLTRRAALAWPDHPAIVSGTTTLTFRELDTRIDAAAAMLAGTVGTGAVVGVPGTLTPELAVLFYAVARSGNVVVTVNPFLRGDALTHVLRASGMRLLFTTPELAERVEPVRVELQALTHLVPADSPFLPGRSPERTGELDDTVCVHFTSGTTGPAKGVRLSHRNLTVNALQVAGGHGLDHVSVVLNHLPTYHLMHLNSALSAGATQVLCPGDDTVAAIDAANAHRATRFYSLPVRLLRLADDPRLPNLKLASVEAIMSGGSALAPAAAGKLSAHFGIPVTQGYGLAETSPLTHTDRIAAPRPGSVGTVVAGTECRIVDVASRAVLASGERGEVQVRGPQVMSGYLDPEQPTGIDADGWLSTGDVGYVDADGYLFLVDRLKDVFKCDNWLVSPTEIEQLAGKHAAVRECVVVDHPDPYRGAVAHAFVVLAEPVNPEQIREWVNAQVPYYQQVQHITAVPAIPRSPNGKVRRRDIRAWVAPTDQP